MEQLILKTVVKFSLFFFVWGPLWWTDIMDPVNEDYIVPEYSRLADYYAGFLGLVFALGTFCLADKVTNYLFRNVDNKEKQ